MDAILTTLVGDAKPLGLIAGILGALLAIPLASIIQVLARDLWDHRAGRPKAQPTVGEDGAPASGSADLTDGKGSTALSRS